MQNQHDQFYLVPGSVLDKILDGQSKILNLLNGQSGPLGKSALGDFISEAEAKKLLGKKTTWFWKMRSSGFLPSSKVGGKNYYRMQDIQKLLDTAFTGDQK